MVARVRLSVLTFWFAGPINLAETKLSSEAESGSYRINRSYPLEIAIRGLDVDLHDDSSRVESGSHSNPNAELEAARACASLPVSTQSAKR